MKKIILISLIALILFLTIGIIYLNNVILPSKIKSLLINNIREETGKSVNIDSLKFNIFKGLVIRGLTIYDNGQSLIELQEASCRVLILPIFKKMIIVPALRLEQAKVFLERRKDLSFNIQDLSVKRGQKFKFSFIIRRIIFSDSYIRFTDYALEDKFTRDLKVSSLDIYFSLPRNLRFRLKSEIPASQPTYINSDGTFVIPEKELRAEINIKNFSPQEFYSYYKNSGINIPGGVIDAKINLKLKDNLLGANLSAQNKGIEILNEKLQLLLNSDINALIQYNLEDKRFELSGSANIFETNVSGLEFVNQVNDIQGELKFSNTAVSSDKLTAIIWDKPVVARLNLNLTDYKNPLLNIHLTSSGLSLDDARKILNDKFKISFPGNIQGNSDLSLDIETRIPANVPLKIGGSLEIKNAVLKLDKIDQPFQDIGGRLEFDSNQLSWPKLHFKYLDNAYETKGSLSNFRSPAVQLELNSGDLFLKSDFTVIDKLIKLSKLEGGYLDSSFNVSGNIDIAEAPIMDANISGKINLEMRNLNKLAGKFKAELDKINPKGIIDAQFNLKGNISELKSCDINAKFFGPSVSFYGLNARDLNLDYKQEEGVAGITLSHLSLYDGTVDAKGKLNLRSQNLPFWLDVQANGIKIEKLKLDTTAKDKDIAGIVETKVKLNGFWNDASKLTGVGNILIRDGKFWQLNLFQGLGKLLFARDFASIIFNEGYCDFSVKDKYIFTDNLKMKSRVVDLSGPVKLGFDNSIDAALNVQVLQDIVPLSGTFKDVTTAIIGEAELFGIIKISGTLAEPKYKFEPALVSIIKGLKDAILGK